MDHRENISETGEDDNDVPFGSDSEAPSVIPTPSRGNSVSARSRGAGDESGADTERETLSPAYLASLRAHINETRARFTSPTATSRTNFLAKGKGKVVHDDEDEYSYEESAPLFSSPWTEEEKDIFFYSLARHSKLRPDLIALDLRSAFPRPPPSSSSTSILNPKPKTVQDITSYITHLSHSTQHSELHLQSKRKWQEIEGRKYTVGSVARMKRRRVGMGCAVEVGEEVVEREERMARGVREWVGEGEGGEGSVMGKVRRRREEEKAVRKEWEKRVKVEGEGGEEEWRIRLERKWDREDWEENVGKSGWVVLDRMLKEAEDSEDSDAGVERVGGDEDEHIREQRMHKRTDHDPLATETTATDFEPRRIDDALIDPALLALDPHPSQPPPPETPNPTSTTPAQSAHPPPPASHPATHSTPSTPPPTPHPSLLPPLFTPSALPLPPVFLPGFNFPVPSTTSSPVSFARFRRI